MCSSGRVPSPELEHETDMSANKTPNSLGLSLALIHVSVVGLMFRTRDSQTVFTRVALFLSAVILMKYLRKSSGLSSSLVSSSLSPSLLLALIPLAHAYVHRLVVPSN